MDISAGPTDKELIFSFGSYRLIPSRQLLLLGDQPVKLGGRVFDMLRLLVQRAGDLVGKDELIAAVWPATFVHESNLKVNMHSLRRTLGDTPLRPTYIATVGGRGYRFVAKVDGYYTSLPETPRLRSDQAAAEPLPDWRDIVGRNTEIAEILEALQRGRHVTIVGTGGVGKTTVAIAAGHAFSSDCPDGVCFVDLSPIDDPAHLPVTVLTALGVRLKAGDQPNACFDALRSRRMLLILDNCEHVLPAAVLFANALVEPGGNIRLLATSRAPLRTFEERIIRIEPLASPDPDSCPSVEEALGFPAVELFVRRAWQWTGYQLVDTDCSSIVSICRALDGLPLAIELVAANVETRGAQKMLESLDSFQDLEHGPTRQFPVRQQTLMATLDWSFRLLSPDEAAIFRLISVFADSFELEDVAAVARATGMNMADVVTGLGGLVSKSLLAAAAHGEVIRHRLLDSTRRYAIRKREEDSSGPLIAHAHAQRILTLFERAEAEWSWREAADWAGRYTGRIADLRAALSWAFGETGDPNLGVRLAAAAIPLWSETTEQNEAPKWVETALSWAQALDCSDLLKAKLACFRASALFYVGGPGGSEDAWTEAILFARRADSLEYEQRGLIGLSRCLLNAGRVGEAIECLRKAEGSSDLDKDWSGAFDGLRALAWTRAHSGELASGRHVLKRLAARDPLGRRAANLSRYELQQIVTTRCYLTFTAFMTGHADHAAMVARDAVEASGRLQCWASQSNALALAALPLSLETGDMNALEKHTKQLHSNLSHDGLSSWMPVYRYYSGHLRDLHGGADGLARIRDAVDEFVDCHRLHWIAMYLAGLSRALVRHGRLDEARERIETALLYQEQQGERWCRPELQRILASILLRDGQREDGENLLKTALAEARAMDGALFELRILNDLAAHYLEIGRSDAAAGELGTLYRTFSEGFATQDLMAASSLLSRATGN